MGASYDTPVFLENHTRRPQTVVDTRNGQAQVRRMTPTQKQFSLERAALKKQILTNSDLKVAFRVASASALTEPCRWRMFHAS